MWACGVAAAARAAATAPGLRLFILGALGGVAGVWEARESGVWCMRFSAEPEGEHMRTSGLLGAGGGGAFGSANRHVTSDNRLITIFRGADKLHGPFRNLAVSLFGFFTFLLTYM